jgi:hypothetical protein
MESAGGRFSAIAASSNTTLKRDSLFRGGFEDLLFFSFGDFVNRP